MANRILDCVSSPEDLKVLSDDELQILALEIREEIIKVTSKTGGHVASSLGAVEIILAQSALPRNTARRATTLRPNLRTRERWLMPWSRSGAM